MTSDMLTMLINMSGSFPTLLVTITFVSVLIGVLIVGQTLLQVYHDSMHDGGGLTVGQAAARCVIGTCLTMPLFVMVVIRNSILPGGVTASGAFEYSSVGTTAEQQIIVQAFYLFFAVVGYIAFVRGWLLADKHVRGVVQDAAWSAFWHIFGGVCLIYLDVFMKFMTDWTGFDFVNLILF